MRGPMARSTCAVALARAARPLQELERGERVAPFYLYLLVCKSMYVCLPGIFAL